MNLQEALRCARNEMYSDSLYGEENLVLVVGHQAKPVLLKYADNILLYIICIYVGNWWRGDQMGLSPDANIASIRRALGPYWRGWNSNIDTYERFYQFDVMSIAGLVAYNKQQHARPASEKLCRESWGNRVLALGG